ncbi:MAG: iron-containing alcohol dehydrogenase family protein [Solirubrobacteraceae bacterium]
MESVTFSFPVPSAFLAPRQLLTGPGSSASLGAALRGSGVESGRVVVVSDAVVAQRGLADRLLDGLSAAGFEPILFSDIAGEPNDETVAHAVDFALENEPVAIAGIGGGSALDVAKLVALLVRNPAPVTDFGGALTPDRPVAPLALVPTTTGTGAEATRIAMMSVGGAKRISSCAQFVPAVAALDSELVAELPPPVVASTAMDALAHALESTLSTNRTRLTALLGAEAAGVILANIEAGVAGDREARGRLLYAAYVAGLALNAGVVLGHSLGYVVARRAHLAHGVSCALALPYCLAYNAAAAGDAGRSVALTVTAGESDDLHAAALAVGALVGRLGLPRSLAEVGIEESQLDEMAAETVATYPRPNNPEPLVEERVRLLLGHMLSGQLDGFRAAGV